MPPPLQGITVVSIEQAVAAPFATRQLADLGARVIKIERPDGGDFARSYDQTVNGLSSYFVWLNRSKESLTLDLKHPAAHTVLDRLLAQADVFVQNLAPGAADRLGVAAADLRVRYPRLITCAVSGYGSSGPFAQKKAYDMLVQAEAGVVSITGTPGTPSRVGISVADIAAGMYAYSGILTALLARTSSGQGTTIDVSLFDALGEWMSAPAYYTVYGGVEPPRSGAAHATIAPYELFVTADGVEIYLAIQNTREWRRFCEHVLGEPALAGEPRFATNAMRVRHRDVLHPVIAEVFARISGADLVALLESAGIAYARRNSVREFVEHPQLAARNRWCNVGSPAGPVRALKPPVQMGGADAVMGDIPSLGQHSERILEELGFEAITIGAWRTEKMI
ncbi:MAG TPA: CaiB/BaiF CoA-transferase family protein [Vicinamibacterales bacterium]|nr:CaiB/BaiF CoA-transferase family protein [Vicinamibacterales bacterium]